MKDPFTRLTEKTANLGNYNRKYLHIISTNIEKLTSSLEYQGKCDRVHLWNHSLEIPNEMDTVLDAATNVEEKLDFLGCYFSLQFLHMNLRIVDIVKLELATNPQRSQIGRRLMLEAGEMFRNLTKCYMERLVNLFLDGKDRPEFVMLGVGTRADQDDIDMGIIHRNPGDADNLNRAISRLSNEMFKKATRLHFHLSEHVGHNSLTATIEQYEQMLDEGKYDFVIVTEMLGAAVIIGDNSLYEQFKARVTNRFNYNMISKENRFHEGYLRGILCEINSLLTRLKPSNSINPKDDGLRPVKTLLTALKLVYGVDKTNAWNIIDDLKVNNPERLSEYNDLERMLSFFEIFRHLYQIMVVQDEDIDLDEPGIEAMVAKIARMIGFEKKGVVSAKDFMLVIYYEFLGKSTHAIEVLTDDLKKHLRQVTIYKSIFLGDIHNKPGYKGNLAVDFIRAATFSKGITYWDDFLEELNDDSKLFYNEFVESFSELPERLYLKVAQGYVAGMRYDPASVLRFLVILGEKAKSDNANKLFHVISNEFVEELSKLPGAAVLSAQMLHAYPKVLNSFLAILDWDCLAKFVVMVHNPPALPELPPVYKQLRALADIHFQSSHFFKRYFHPVLNKFSVFIKNLHNNDKLKEITDGFYSDITSLPSLDERIERLGDYYDLEFVRVSLLAMAGADCERTDAEFIEFCDNYTLLLYEFCQRDVRLSMGYSTRAYDVFAIYATGGHAREQGFDDDYDLIVILDSTDPDEIDYCNKIVGKMNSHILKRGILPHHHFADHYGSYVISVNQLAQHLSGKGEEIFVDQSQILSSRILVGSRRLERKLQQDIIIPYIFSRGHEYIQRMQAELISRHDVDDTSQIDDIKECRGGLRDIEMLLLMYKVKHKVRDPLSRKFLKRLSEIEPEFTSDFRYMEQHLNFLKNLRDLYRLKVAASNVIDREYLSPVAETIMYGDSVKAAQRLYDDFLERCEEAARVIEKLVASIRV